MIRRTLSTLAYEIGRVAYRTAAWAWTLAARLDPEQVREAAGTMDRGMN